MRWFGLLAGIIYVVPVHSECLGACAALNQTIVRCNVNVQNWARGVTCTPKCIAEPSEAAQVRKNGNRITKKNRNLLVVLVLVGPLLFMYRL